MGAPHHRPAHPRRPRGKEGRKGVTLGRPRTLPDKVRERDPTATEAGQSAAQIARDLEADQVPTARGGARWWPSAVRSIALAGR